MFTGIVTDIGTINEIRTNGDLTFKIGTDNSLDQLEIGASIACDGVCLTVVDHAGGDPDWFEVQVSRETISKTTAGSWSAGRKINLERSLRVGDELGGHIVSGHVDGVARVVELAESGDSVQARFGFPDELACYIARKGSIALNGVSITVNEVERDEFTVNLIPHTRSVTNLGGISAGDKVNIEIDTLARYVTRIISLSG